MFTRPSFRIAAAAGLAALAASLAGCGHLSPSRVAGTATSYASLQLCGAVFIGGMDADTYFHEAVEPRSGPLKPFIRYVVDRGRGEVRTTLAGLAMSRASFRGPLGCVTSTDHLPAPVTLPALPLAAPVLPPIAGSQPVPPANPALDAALAHAFEESPQPPHRYTKAIVVVQHGSVVGERYAADIGVETPLLGWSATKSVTNALTGILVREQRLDVHATAPVAAWASDGDPRHAITVDQLLRMTSGLDAGDSLNASILSAFDRSAQMTLLESDKAACAERAPLAAPPGSHWQYADGNTQLLSRIIRDRVGGDAASVYAFAHRELFDKLGMERATFEFDAAGTPVGASRLWATARDWARFGMLYLHDGVVGGERILPAGWVDYSATLTPGSEYAGYGAGFWTNRADTGGARKRTDAGMPRDAFMARGTDGQYVIVIPSRDMVIARFGNSLAPGGDIGTVDQLVAEVVAALAQPGATP
jgi:CubicO group peptidase (beta-lactamase class C family)